MTIPIRPQKVWADLASVRAVIGSETVDVPIIGLATVDVNGNISVGAVSVGTVATPSGTITRPNDTTTYATGEVFANATGLICTIANCGRVAGGSGTIISGIVVSSANQTLKAQLELWLFDSSVTQDADNTLFTPTDAECLNLMGIIPLNTSYVGDAAAAAAGNSVYTSGVVNLLYKCAAGSTSLYAVLVVRNAYIPVVNQTMAIKLRVVQD